MSLCFKISLNSAPPGGLATAPGRQRWSWMERALGVGDRITITVVQSGSPTAPDRVQGEIHNGGNARSATTMNTSVASSETRHERPD